MGLVSPRGDDEEDADLQIQLGGELWLGGLENLDGREDEVRFDLSAWPDEHRSRLRERLDLFMVVSYWADETTLAVTEPLDQVYLDRVIAQVKDEAERGVAHVPAAEAARGSTSPVASDAPQGQVDDEIGYDLDGWDEVNRSVLFAALEAEGIKYRITIGGEDGDELIVAESDEVRVDELIDEIIDPEGDDGTDVPPELLGELFVAADRLVHDPLEPDARRAMQDKVEVASGSRPPFGTERAWWRGITEQAEALVEQFDDTSLEHEVIAGAATALRDALRPFV